MDYKKGLTIIESTDIDVEQKMLSMCSQIEDKYDYILFGKFNNIVEKNINDTSSIKYMLLAYMNEYYVYSYGKTIYNFKDFNYKWHVELANSNTEIVIVADNGPFIRIIAPIEDASKCIYYVNNFEDIDTITSECPLIKQKDIIKMMENHGKEATDIIFNNIKYRQKIALRFSKSKKVKTFENFVNTI